MDTLSKTISTVTETVTTASSYSVYMLCFLGIIGIILHNLVKLDSLNKQGAGSINWGQYFRIEWISILISIIAVLIGALFLQHELKRYFAMFANYIGIGFIFFGYFAQSLLVKFMGKGQKAIDNLNKPDTDNP